jgi:hypothetical protein
MGRFLKRRTLERSESVANSDLTAIRKASSTEYDRVEIEICQSSQSNYQENEMK